jgi:uncharacterized lipoprotein YajG
MNQTTIDILIDFILDSSNPIEQRRNVLVDVIKSIYQDCKYKDFIKKNKIELDNP